MGTVIIHDVADPHIQGTIVPLNVQIVVGVNPVPVKVNLSGLFQVFPS